MAKRSPSFFFPNPARREISAILAGNSISRIRRITHPRSGWTALKLKVFPKSASEANNPQKVKRNG